MTDERTAASEPPTGSLKKILWHIRRVQDGAGDGDAIERESSRSTSRRERAWLEGSVDELELVGRLAAIVRGPDDVAADAAASAATSASETV